jgi:hypothetical protein
MHHWNPFIPVNAPHSSLDPPDGQVAIFIR